jgi:hypothetical protein
MAQPHLASSPVITEENQLRLLLLEAVEDDVFLIKEELTRNLTSPFTLRWADSLEAFFAAFAEFAPMWCCRNILGRTSTAARP